MSLCESSLFSFQCHKAALFWLWWFILCSAALSVTVYNWFNSLLPPPTTKKDQLCLGLHRFFWKAWKKAIAIIFPDLLVSLAHRLYALNSHLRSNDCDQTRIPPFETQPTSVQISLAMENATQPLSAAPMINYPHCLKKIASFSGVISPAQTSRQSFLLHFSWQDQKASVIDFCSPRRRSWAGMKSLLNPLFVKLNTVRSWSFSQ